MIRKAYHAFRSRRRPRPRFLANGVLEYWSIGVLRQVRIAPRDRGVEDREWGQEDREWGQVNCCPS